MWRVIISDILYLLKEAQKNETEAIYGGADRLCSVANRHHRTPKGKQHPPILHETHTYCSWATPKGQVKLVCSVTPWEIMLVTLTIDWYLGRLLVLRHSCVSCLTVAYVASCFPG